MCIFILILLTILNSFFLYSKLEHIFFLKSSFCVISVFSLSSSQSRAVIALSVRFPNRLAHELNTLGFFMTPNTFFILVNSFLHWISPTKYSCIYISVLSLQILSTFTPSAKRCLLSFCFYKLIGLAKVFLDIPWNDNFFSYKQKLYTPRETSCL